MPHWIGHCRAVQVVLAVFAGVTLCRATHITPKRNAVFRETRLYERPSVKVRRHEKCPVQPHHTARRQP